MKDRVANDPRKRVQVFPVSRSAVCFHGCVPAPFGIVRAAASGTQSPLLSAIPRNRAPRCRNNRFSPERTSEDRWNREGTLLFLSRRTSLALPVTLVQIPRNLNGRTSRRKPSDSISQDSCHSCHSSLGILECSRTEYRSHNVEIDSEEPWRLIEFVVAIPISIWEFVFEYSHRRMSSRNIY